jgi:hypothetical protein
VLPVARPEVTGCRRHHLDRRAGRLADEIAGEGKPDDLLTSFEVAGCLSVTEQWMWTGRRENYGPVFIQPFPEVIRYRRGDVVKWLRARARLAAEYA